MMTGHGKARIYIGYGLLRHAQLALENHLQANADDVDAQRLLEMVVEKCNANNISEAEVTNDAAEAQILYEDGRYDEAKALLDQHLKIEPEDPAGLSLLWKYKKQGEHHD